VRLTTRFKSPINRPANISLASSLCPTSSKASVASCPPTSSRTSSPPLYASQRQFIQQSSWGSATASDSGTDLYVATCLFPRYCTVYEGAPRLLSFTLNTVTVSAAYSNPLCQGSRSGRLSSTNRGQVHVKQIVTYGCSSTKLVAL
jgi:hypothetical protein